MSASSKRYRPDPKKESSGVFEALERALLALNEEGYPYLQCCNCYMIAHEDDPHEEFKFCYKCDTAICRYCFDGDEFPAGDVQVLCGTCD